ncbi:hypothetical protein ACXDF8_11500 [Mycolicibacterium sp. CBM1]
MTIPIDLDLKLDEIRRTTAARVETAHLQLTAANRSADRAEQRSGLTPTAIIVESPDGKAITLPLRAGSWSGSGFTARAEFDGQRVLVHVDVTRT